MFRGFDSEVIYVSKLVGFISDRVLLAKHVSNCHLKAGWTILRPN